MHLSKSRNALLYNGAGQKKKKISQGEEDSATFVVVTFSGARTAESAVMQILEQIGKYARRDAASVPACLGDVGGMR